MPAGSRSRTLPVTRASSTIFFTLKRAAAFGRRTLDHRFGIPVRGRTDGRHLFRPRHPRRGRDSPARQRALSTSRLELGPHAGPTLTLGWRPENGFIQYRWQGTTKGCCSTSSVWVRRRIRCRRKLCRVLRDVRMENIYDRELLYSGPLFTHQLSHMWIHFRGIRYAFMMTMGATYFENSRQATFVQQEYAIRNPMILSATGNRWGFTTCTDPAGVSEWSTASSGSSTITSSRRSIQPRRRHGRAVGGGRFAAFAPEIVIPTVGNFARMDLGMTRLYGFKPSFNQSYVVEGSLTGRRVSPYHFGLDQGRSS